MISIGMLDVVGYYMLESTSRFYCGRCYANANLFSNT